LWVAPVEVEECLMCHDAVSLAAVIGVEDEGLMKPKAFVVLRMGVTRDHAALAAELQEHVKARLAKHKYPRLIEFVADVPKNDRGKVDRMALRAAEAKKRR
jgi:acyl-coenzyme A synthetase/AMP-(fatty) acid ligase